jgi:hypothetical protein
MYVIAIPSYKRANTCNNKTLKCLNTNGIDKNLINVFVIQEEYEEYVAILNPDYYNKIIIGEKGLIQQREFIQYFYSENTKIVSLDDDIEVIDLSLTDYLSLDEFFIDAFIKCEDSNTYLWSVYPVFNEFFRKSKKECLEGLSFCIGAFYGYINRYDEDLKISLTREGNKEDVERSILYWLKDSKTLRFNKIGFKTKYYGVGGLGGLKDRLEINKLDAIAINDNYPTFTRIKIRKNGLYEIVFKDKNVSPPLKIQEIVELPKLDETREDINQIYDMLQSITIPQHSTKSGRARKFGVHRAMSLGMIKERVSRNFGLSLQSRKHPALYEAIVALGKSFVPFDFNAIHINHNVACPRHLDVKNVGKSCLISIGKYEGCDLVVENIGEFNTNCRPIIFDGVNMYHWNTPLLSGNKYSLVFYTNKDC